MAAKPLIRTLRALILTVTGLAIPAAGQAQSSRYDSLASMPFRSGYIAKGNNQTLLDELFFQRAVQTYLWAHEIKLDGFRMAARIERGEVTQGPSQAATHHPPDAS
jgi:hypothetical protein